MNRVQPAFLLTVWTALVVWQAGLAPSSAAAQLQILRGNAVLADEDEAELDGQKLFVSDRQLWQRLMRSQELIREGDAVQAVVLLQSILDHPEDFFYNPEQENRANFRSLKAETQRLIAELPEEGRRSYELQFGPNARQLFEEATDPNDPRLLEEVVRRFFHTQAGYEAAYRLGTFHLDRSEPLTAALHFSRLRKFPRKSKQWEPMLTLKTAVCWGRAGLPEQSIQTLLELKQQDGGKPIHLGGREVALFETEEEALPWLVDVLGRQPEFAAIGEEKWTMFRGNASRNAVSSPASPIWDDHWQFASIQMTEIDDELQARLNETEEELKELEERHRGTNFLAIPSTHPLVIDDAVVFRSLGNLKAVDSRTGRLLWETATHDPHFRRLLEQENVASARRGTNQPSAGESFLTQRAWRDLTSGTLSSDGKYVFSLEELGFLGPFPFNPQGPQHPLAPHDYNKMMAFELSSGKAAWVIGGPRGEHELPLAGSFFLGPPLPLAGRLYCLAENNGEIRLLVLKPVPENWTVELEWSQSLILPPETLLQYPVRRLAGISPSYSEGVMICPTSAGAVVGVDMARRMLLWGYRYPTNQSTTPRNRRAFVLGMMRGQAGGMNNDDEERWLDSSPTIVDGRVLLTPRDSDELHCISLVDGELLWKRPRGQLLYVATVHDEKVVLVGRTRVEAYHLNDGTPAWSEPTPISMPSGRGYATRGIYYVPLSTGEIAGVDLETGRILAVSRSRSERIPGNLVAVDGTVISQTAAEVTGFKPLGQLEQEIEEGLQTNPEGADLLALRGELRLQMGDEAGGLDDLRRSLELQPSDRTRELIVSTLLDGIRIDFGTYRQAAAEVESLLKDSKQRSLFLRRYAEGLRKIGEQEAAFGEYLKLVEAVAEDPVLERMDGLLSVRSDRWIRPKIAELYAHSSGEQQQRLREQVRSQLNRIREIDDLSSIARMLDSFGELPIADDFRRDYLERIDAESRPLEFERQLRLLLTAEAPETAGFATARLASWLIEQNRIKEAADLLPELNQRFAEVECLDGQTGRELVENWRDDEQIARALSPSSIWPEHKLLAQRQGRQGNIERYYALEVQQADGPCADWSFQLDQRRQNVIALDGEGVEQWTLSVADAERQVPNVYGNYAHISGNLIALVLGDRFVLVDASASNGEPNILWKADLYDRPAGQPGMAGVQLRQVVLPGGVRKMTVMDPFGRPMGTVGILTGQLVCYQSGTELMAADPLTGDILWTRSGIPRGSELFGDDQFVCAVAPNADHVTVFRAGDGQQVAIRKLPDSDSRLATRNHSILSWDRQDNAQWLRLRDALSGQIVWQREFADRSQVALVEDDEVAILDPAGNFAILSIEDGKPRLETRVEPEEGLSNIVVRRSRERYVLMTHRPDNQQNNVRAVSMGYNNPLVNGHVYGFDRQTGTKIWTQPVEQQSFELNQPKNLPILVFTVRTYKMLQQARVFNSYEFALLILDERSGEIVYENRGSESLSPFELQIDPEGQKIDLNFFRSAIALRFFDPEAVPEPVEAEKPPVEQSGQDEASSKNENGGTGDENDANENEGEQQKQDADDNDQTDRSEESDAKTPMPVPAPRRPVSPDQPE